MLNVKFIPYNLKMHTITLAKYLYKFKINIEHYEIIFSELFKL